MHCNLHQKYFQQHNIILTRNSLHIPLEPPICLANDAMQFPPEILPTIQYNFDQKSISYSSKTTNVWNGMHCNLHHKYFQQYNTILTRNPLHFPPIPPLPCQRCNAISSRNTFNNIIRFWPEIHCIFLHNHQCLDWDALQFPPEILPTIQYHFDQKSIAYSSKTTNVWTGIHCSFHVEYNATPLQCTTSSKNPFPK